MNKITSGEVIVFIWQRKLQLVAAISPTTSQRQSGLAMWGHVIDTTGDEGLNVIIMLLGTEWWMEVWFEPYTRWIQGHFISYFNLAYNYFAVIRNRFSLKTIYDMFRFAHFVYTCMGKVLWASARPKLIQRCWSDRMISQCNTESSVHAIMSFTTLPELMFSYRQSVAYVETEVKSEWQFERFDPEADELCVARDDN